MKKLSIILATLALSFIVAHLWLGPIYTMYDGCLCGQRRAWFEFNENPKLRDVKLFLRITSPGDPQHKHEFYDAQYDSQNSIIGFIGVGLGLANIVIWFRSCRKPH